MTLYFIEKKMFDFLCDLPNIYYFYMLKGQEYTLDVHYVEIQQYQRIEMN